MTVTPTRTNGNAPSESVQLSAMIRLLARAMRHPFRAVRFLVRQMRTEMAKRSPAREDAHHLPSVNENLLRRLAQSAPIDELPFPVINLTEIINPIPEILTAPEFEHAWAALLEDPLSKRSLLSTVGQALLYTLIRNQRPMHIYEIGTYRGGTSEVMARALLANGVGILHTVGPFDEAQFRPVLDSWHPSLKGVVRFYPVDSMAFYMQMQDEGVRPGIVLVDGNHDYEFVSFDIHSAARSLLPGGFIIVDDILQAGPFLAIEDFLEKHPGWIECNFQPRQRDRTKSFDRERSTIPNTGISVLRAPFHYLIGDRPTSFGDGVWRTSQVRGLTLVLGGHSTIGQLHIQCILRGFGADRIVEIVTSSTVTVQAGTEPQSHITIVFDKPPVIENEFPRYSVESWFIWTGPEPLQLCVPPVIF